MPFTRSLRARTKQQTRLAFSPLSSSSPVKENYPIAIQDRLANVRHTGSKPASTSSTPAEDEFKRESLPTPEPSSQAAVVESSSEEDALPSTKRRRLAMGKTVEDQITPTRKSTRVTRGATSLACERVDQASAPQTITSSPLPRVSPGSSSETSRRLEFDALSNLGEPETTGDEDEVLVTKPIQRRRQSKRGVAEDPFVVDDDRIEYLSSCEEPVAKRKSRKLTVNEWLAADDQIEYVTSNDDGINPNSRKGQKVKKPKRRRSRDEQEELEDDLADLRDSDHSFENTPRTRGGPVTTQRDKAKQHFETLKRRRAGERISRVLDSEDEQEEEHEPVDIDGIGNDGLIGAPYEISDNSSASGDDAVEEAEEDFVVDDVSSHRLDLPHPDIPLEFTSYASAKPRDLFEHVIEWLVKNRIAPAFSRDDPIYKLALSKVSDQVTAQAGSRLISAAWNADFKYAILARPNVQVTFLDDSEDADGGFRTCDACNRTNHPAKYDFVLSGEPYQKRDLEPVNDDSDNGDDDEDQGRKDYDEAGHLLPSQGMHFYLGRFCAANAQMGHKLMHWQYHLNQNLLGYLEEQGVLSAGATLARDKMNRTKREKEAEAIVDSMQETGVIQELWRAFQSDLDDARLGMEDFDKRGRHGQARVKSTRSTNHAELLRLRDKDKMRDPGRGENDGSDDDD